MNKDAIGVLNIISNQVSSDYAEEIYTIRTALERPQVDTIAVKRGVLEKFVNAKREAEKILIDKTSENYSEWLSAFIHHVNYRLSYADWEKLEAALLADKKGE